MAERSRKKKRQPLPDFVDATWHPDRPMGLARSIAKSGRATRAKATEIIRSGRVKVDGRVVTDPSVCVSPQSEILIDDSPLLKVVYGYFALHKPVKVICTPADRGGRRLVSEFFPPEVPGLCVAGRLDANTSGLILVSNDSVWNDHATNYTQLEREYRVQVRGRLTEMEIGIIRAGVTFPNLGLFRPKSVVILESRENQTILRMVIREGKNRQLRGVFNSLRHDVLSLRRTRIGPVKLGNLNPGRIRALAREEIDGIWQAAQQSG
jgi:23S rRNA pseudouridine2605 synthase